MKKNINTGPVGILKFPKISEEKIEELVNMMERSSRNVVIITREPARFEQFPKRSFLQPYKMMRPTRPKKNLKS